MISIDGGILSNRTKVDMNGMWRALQGSTLVKNASIVLCSSKHSACSSKHVAMFKQDELEALPGRQATLSTHPCISIKHEVVCEVRASIRAKWNGIPNQGKMCDRVTGILIHLKNHLYCPPRQLFHLVLDLPKKAKGEMLYFGHDLIFWLIWTCACGWRSASCSVAILLVHTQPMHDLV